MCAWIVPPVAGLIEPTPAPEIYIENIGGAEVIGAIVRIPCYCEECPIERGLPQKVIKLWVRRPLVRTPAILSMLALINERMIDPGAPPIVPGNFKPFLVS